MKITQDIYDQLTVLTVKGDLTADHVEMFQKAVEERFEKKGRDFVIDLSQTDHIDSKGLESLLWLQEKCVEKLGQVRLAGTTADAETILQITRLAARFDRHPDVDSAVKGLRI